MAQTVTQSQFGFIAEISSQGQLAPIALSNLGQASCEKKPASEAGKRPDAFATCGLYGEVIRNARGFFTNELISPPERVGIPPGHPLIQAFLGVPLFHDGKILGMVGLANRKAGYRPEDLQAVQGLSVAIVQTLLHKRAELALRQAQNQLSIHAQELEQTVAQRTAKLQESIAELEHFSYAITHDMRAPLRAVQGFSAIIEAECAGCQRASLEFFRRIQRASHRMDQLITDSLNYSRIARQELSLQPVNLRELLSGLVESYPNLQPDNAEIQLAPDLPKVLGNESALTQCFSNLLGNAVKFVKPGVKPQIHVWAEPEKNRPAGQRRIRERSRSCGHQHSGDDPLLGESSAGVVRIWVEDNGIGIPQSYQTRVFDMFQRVCNDREGTGIGLAIVRKIARRLGGEVGVESAEGQGSRFWVQLLAADS